MTTIHPSSIQNPQQPASVQSTPGLEIPGAFPHEHTATTRQRPLSDSHRQQPISLPSTEKEGSHPGDHCGGVGSLPGSISETSVAKLPEERASEARAASAPSSRSKEVFADTDTDRGDAVEPTVAPASLLAAKVPEGEAESAPASRSKELAADTGRGDEAVTPAVGPSVSTVPDERAGEGKVDSESALRPKELAADTGREGDDVAAAGSSVAPGITTQDSPVQKTEPQGITDDVVGKPVPAEQQPSETADIDTPADSKFKEELKKEKSSVDDDEGPRTLPQPPASAPPAPFHATAAGDLAMPKGAQEDPNKAAPVEQQQQPQSEIAGGGLAPRKGRSSSDSDASNHMKASIMNRVKGEMKVLLGKASGNKDKVEEGVRMKQGGTQ